MTHETARCGLEKFLLHNFNTNYHQVYGAAAIATLMILLAFHPSPVAAGEQLFFQDIAREGTDLNNYQRTRSTNSTVWDNFIERGFLTPLDLEDTPHKWRGAPGVAILDFDNDGDADIYVTNGPGSNNSLFANQLTETGTMSFVDIGEIAGVGARTQDSSGVCFGDIDNDGDPDLLVVSPFDSNRLFENNGNGTFTDITAAAGLGGDESTSVSCSFGDIDSDGLLDVIIANNNEDWNNLKGLGQSEAFLFNQHNDLYRNQGGGSFIDISDSSGIRNTRGGFPEQFDGSPTITWAVAMVDYDMDGDTDIIQADDQGGFPNIENNGFDRGLIRIFRNDGTGHFEDATVESNMQFEGQWMGLSFGDINGDGFLDIFGTNAGDWAGTINSSEDPVYADFGPFPLGISASLWFLGGSGGIFSRPGLGDLTATPFGWGTSMADYDNDSDTDILYHGGFAFGPTVTHDNPGVLLRNDGAGNFTYDAEALADSTDHRRRTVHGMAVGDLNDDGFQDIVSVSNMDAQDSILMANYRAEWGSPFDGITQYQATFVPTETPGVWSYGLDEDNIDGSLSVEISSGNSNHWAKVKLIGGAGLITGSHVNRDGIGAVVSFTTSSGRSTMRPILGGSSYASQDSLELSFGLGARRKGQLDVLWPGGMRNRLYNVRRNEQILFPEIPCSIDVRTRFREYKACVRNSLNEWLQAGVIDRQQKNRFFVSAVIAFFDD